MKFLRPWHFYLSSELQLPCRKLDFHLLSELFWLEWFWPTMNTGTNWKPPLIRLKVCYWVYFLFRLVPVLILYFLLKILIAIIGLCFSSYCCKIYSSFYSWSHFQIAKRIRFSFCLFVGTIE